MSNTDLSKLSYEQIGKLVSDLKTKLSQKEAVKPSKSGEWLLKVGTTYFIRTVTYHYTGKLVGFNGPNNSELVIESAAWIADSGRFATAIKDGKLSEVEPYPDGTLVAINRTAIVDYCAVTWDSPRSQK